MKKASTIAPPLKMSTAVIDETPVQGDVTSRPWLNGLGNVTVILQDTGYESL